MKQKPVCTKLACTPTTCVHISSHTQMHWNTLMNRYTRTYRQILICSYLIPVHYAAFSEYKFFKQECSKQTCFFHIQRISRAMSMRRTLQRFSIWMSWETRMHTSLYESNIDITSNQEHAHLEQKIHAYPLYQCKIYAHLSHTFTNPCNCLVQKSNDETSKLHEWSTWILPKDSINHT